MIAWVRGKRSSAWYRPSAIEQFITQELEQPCRAHVHETSLNFVDNGSQKNQVVPAYTVSGMTQEMEEHAARASAQRILKPQRSASPK